MEDLPAYDELMQSIQDSGKFNKTGENLYEIKSSSLYNGETEEKFFEEMEGDETPDFLKDEDYLEVSSDDTTVEDPA